IWKVLDRAMAADKAAGRIGDDGTQVERYMGVPRPAPPASVLPASPAPASLLPRLPRALRALLDPRVSHALTGVGRAAGGAFITYLIMKGPAEPPHGSTVDARAHAAAAASVARLLGPEPLEAPEPQANPGAGELRPDAGPA